MTSESGKGKVQRIDFDCIFEQKPEFYSHFLIKQEQQSI